MAEYIERELVLRAMGEEPLIWLDDKDEVQANDDWHIYTGIVKAIPAADVVSRVAFEQIMWERDQALHQLEEHGLTLGCKADVVPVVRCRDCTYLDKAIVTKKGFVICPASGMEIMDDDFCSCGERRSE